MHPTSATSHALLRGTCAALPLPRIDPLKRQVVPLPNPLRQPRVLQHFVCGEARHDLHRHRERLWRVRACPNIMIPAPMAQERTTVLIQDAADYFTVALQTRASVCDRAISSKGTLTCPEPPLPASSKS